MKIRSVVTVANIGFIFLLLVGIAVEAAEVKVLSVGGMRAVMKDLGPKFERATGHKLAITFGGNLGAVVKRVQDGDTADVVIMPPSGFDGFLKDGKAASGNVTAVARAGFGVAVRKGATKPDISTPEALKRTLLAAKSIAYANPVETAAGIQVIKILDGLGLAEARKSKTVFPKGGQVGALVANGEAEIAVHHIQQLIPVSGIEIIGPLPKDLQVFDVFAAGIMAGAKNVEASKALVNFLRTPDAAIVLKANGMEPGTP